MKLKDAAGWQRQVDINKNDSYSLGVITFAERWADLMAHVGRVMELIGVTRHELRGGNRLHGFLIDAHQLAQLRGGRPFHDRPLFDLFDVIEEEIDEVVSKAAGSGHGRRILSGIVARAAPHPGPLPGGKRGLGPRKNTVPSGEGRLSRKPVSSRLHPSARSD